MNRLKKTFETLKSNDKKAFSAFLMSGYPNDEIFLELLKICSDTGVDFIEVGMPFSDPSADGPTIKLAGTHALEGGTNVKNTIKNIKKFRQYDSNTPIVWMGYFNSIFNYGAENFAKEIKEAGVDALLVVDLPPEETHRIEPIQNQNIDIIRLITPVTDEERLNEVLKHAGGFIYFVSITGITGTKEAEDEKIKNKVEHVKSLTDLPVIVGFGIKTPEKAQRINSFADGSIVGSALIEQITKHIDEKNQIDDKESLFEDIRNFLSSFVNPT